MTRQAARVDKNHREIRDELRRHGYKVLDSSRAGDDFPDLVIVSRSGRVAMLFEVKTEEYLRADRLHLGLMLKLVDPVYRIVLDAEQALEIMREID